MPPFTPLTYRSSLWEAPTESHLQLVASLRPEAEAVPLAKRFSLSLAGHVALLALCILLLWLAQVMGLHAPPQSTSPTIEMVIVNQRTAPPKNPNTTRRAEHATRAGGEKRIDKLNVQQVAGAVAPTVAPAPQASPTPPAKTSASVVPPTRKTAETKPTPRTPKATEASEAPATPRTRPKAQIPKSQVIHSKQSTASQVVEDVDLDAPSPIVSRPKSASASSSSASSSGSRLGPQAISSSHASTPRQASAGGSGSRHSSLGGAAGGGGEAGLDALAAPDMGAYVRDIERRVRNNWNPVAGNTSRAAMFRLVIARNGRLLSCSLIRSSGSDVFDAGGRAALEAASPFRPLPANFNESQFVIDFKLDFSTLQ